MVCTFLVYYSADVMCNYKLLCSSIAAKVTYDAVLYCYLSGL